MDHSGLVAELPRIEKLTAADRLRIARDRRINQLRLHEQYERELSMKDKSLSNQQKRTSNKNRGVRFILSVMLLEAAARNDTEEVRRLLTQGGNPDSTNEDGLTALHQCCIDDSESMMKLLLEFGANVNAEDSEKWTPLHAAATCGHLHLVKYLISKGANLLAVNADGNMPYDICEDESALDYIESEMARRGVTQELIDQTRASNERQMLAELMGFAANGGSLELEDAVGARPLHVAAANGYLSVVEFLLDQHVATDAKDMDGWQPIHAAACWGHLEVVEMLVQNGSDLNAQTKNLETPFDICEDPDMKLRIAALRNEQENRARADHQKNRRSQSTSANTRTHSIRRNSTRDKGQISKKYIKDEAIFGIQNDDDTAQESDRDRARDVISASSVADGEASISDQNFRMKKSGRNITPEEHLIGTNGVPRNHSNSKRQAPPPPSSLRSENDSSTDTSVPSKPHYLSPSYLTSSALNDNTIDIRVSVTINTVNPEGICRPAMLPVPSPLPTSIPTSLPSLILRTSSPACHQPSYAPSVLPNILQSFHSLSGGSCTLSDLKKQRSQYRVVGLAGSATSTEYPIPNSFIFPPSESSGTGDVGDVKGQIEPLSSWSTLPDQNVTNGHNPTDGVKKFTGETELIGGTKTRDSSCCNLS